MTTLLISTVAALVVSAAAVAQTASGVVMLKDSSGASVRAVVAGADDAPAGILLVHDYFGFSDFYTKAALHLAAQGFKVVAIDLYQGQAATTGDAAVQLMQKLQKQDRAITNRALQAGIDALLQKHPNRRIGTLGFSAGGIDAFNATLANPKTVQATAMIYGFGFGQLPADAIASVQGPILTVTGALDEGSLQATVDLMGRRSALSAPLELHVMPHMGHAYAQPLFDGGKGYSPEATAQTWAAIDHFFAHHLLGFAAP